MTDATKVTLPLELTWEEMDALLWATALGINYQPGQVQMSGPWEGQCLRHRGPLSSVYDKLKTLSPELAKKVRAACDAIEEATADSV